MANKLLNVRMDQEMIEDLKKVCGELEISVTDAIKLFSNQLIKERALPTEEEENTVFNEDKILKSIKESLEETKEIGYNQEKYIQLHNELSSVLAFYCKEFGTLVESKTCCNKDGKPYVTTFNTPYFIEHSDTLCSVEYFYTPYSKIVKIFKEKYEEKLKNKIIDKITEFYQEYYNQLILNYEKDIKMEEEENKKMQIVLNDKYIDVMENLKIENSILYKDLLNKYSYNIDYYTISDLDCENYSDAKKKLEEFLTPEEIKEYYAFNSKLYNCETKEEKEKLIENIKKDEKKSKILKSAINKFEEYKNKKNSQKQIESNNNSEEK